MTNARARENALPAPIIVDLSSVSVRVEDAFRAFVALRDVFGASETYLLESLAGPDRDCRRAVIGVGPVLTLSVSGSVITLSGEFDVVNHMHAALAGSPYATDDGPGRLIVDNGHMWDLLRTFTDSFDVTAADAFSFGFGALSVFGYDAVHYIEDLPRIIPEDDEPPQIMLRIYRSTLELDLKSRQCRVTSSQALQWQPHDPRDLVAIVTSAGHLTMADAPAAAPAELTFTTTAQDYRQNVAIALEHIRVGDIYQVQLGHEISAAYAGDELEVYRRLRASNPAPYMGFIPTPDFTVLSASPELHVLVQGELATMRPIAGTVRRTHDEHRDAEAVEWLSANEKESAEHVMLIDLCRNDLGRVGCAGSMTVTDMMTVETYANVFHLVSTVSVKLAPGVDIYDVICATFPAGTMTGAPKIRAMEIVETLEASRRGIYAGTFGLIGFGGFAELALCIRTIVSNGSFLRTRASAGVVADSSAEGEWAETLAKMRSSVLAMTGEDIL